MPRDPTDSSTLPSRKHPTAHAYKHGYDAALVKAALRYPGTSSGYTGGWF